MDVIIYLKRVIFYLRIITLCALLTDHLQPHETKTMKQKEEKKLRSKIGISNK